MYILTQILEADAISARHARFFSERNSDKSIKILLLTFCLRWYCEMDSTYRNVADRHRTAPWALVQRWWVSVWLSVPWICLNCIILYKLAAGIQHKVRFWVDLLGKPLFCCIATHGCYDWFFLMIFLMKIYHAFRKKT